MWIVITVSAACFQTLRNAVSRSLVAHVSPLLNSWSRFAFTLPFCGCLILALSLLHGAPMLSQRFLIFCALTAVTHMTGNLALVSAFARTNFAKSIVLHKLEVVFAALLGVFVFAEVPSAMGWLGIAICAIGVLLVNPGRQGDRGGWARLRRLDTGSTLSLLSGTCLAAASFFLKEAAGTLYELNEPLRGGYFEAAAYSLFHTTWIEVALLSAFVFASRPQEVRRVRYHWRRMALVGFVGFCGSQAWFWAYSLALVAYVKAVGQFELIGSVAISIFIFRERNVLQQLPGIAVITVGILLVVMG